MAWSAHQRSKGSGQKHVAYLSLGSNMGSRRAHLRCALEGLSAKGVVAKCSGMWQTRAWGYQDDRDYLNLACCFLTDLDVWALHRHCQEVEVDCGRREKSLNGSYEAREIDIDILFFDELVLREEDLEIPHPRLELRNFVLQPMMEIAPQLKHPKHEKTIAQLLAECPDEQLGSKTEHGL